MSPDLFDRVEASVLGQSTYEGFRKTLIASDCRRCGLSAKRTHIVVDRGNPEARVVIVGEAPGRNEDEQGLAFVGRAGKLLDGMLAELGFDTNHEALIINVVKCRPPDNRPPTAQEAQTCMPFLRKQMGLVKPKVVLLLGATALKHLIPDKAKNAMRGEVGQFFTHPDYDGMQIMVLYHPAYILRDPRKRPIMQEHLLRFKSFWEELHKTGVIARKTTY